MGKGRPASEVGAITLADKPLPLAENGIRPINLGVDLPALADLMEVGFGSALDESGRSMIREMRSLGRSGWLLNATNKLTELFGGIQQGYVWIEDGQMVGNVSTMPMTPIQSGEPGQKGAIIANVVVHPDYRRQRIAQRLLQASLTDLEKQNFTYASLQVLAHNTGALRLYEQFGFRIVRTFTRWVRPGRLSAPMSIPNFSGLPEVTLRPNRDWRAEYSLADRVRPNILGGLGWLRPTVPGAINPSWLERIGGWLVGYARESWVIYDPKTASRADWDRSILASARLIMSFGSPDRIDLLVDPAVQGKVERLLLSTVLQRLTGHSRAVLTEHPSDDVGIAPVFAELGFESRRTETTMRLDFHQLSDMTRRNDQFSDLNHAV